MISQFPNFKLYIKTPIAAPGVTREGAYAPPNPSLQNNTIRFGILSKNPAVAPDELLGNPVGVTTAGDICSSPFTHGCQLLRGAPRGGFQNLGNPGDTHGYPPPAAFFFIASFRLLSGELWAMRWASSRTKEFSWKNYDKRHPSATVP